MPPSDDPMPTTLTEFGYGFNNAGELRQLHPETGEPTDKHFQFVVRPADHAYNQRRYEALGQLMTEHVYALLLEAGLQRIDLPGGAFVFASRADLLRQPGGADRLLILIHGSGVVRAGQWARSLIMNVSLDHGTQLPYVRRAQRLGYDVLVLNPNENRNATDGRPLANSAEPHQHAAFVWQTLVRPGLTDGSRIAIVAHSFGGPVALALRRHCAEDFERHVRAVAFTDSVHGPAMEPAAEEFCRRAVRNWIASERPLDERIPADGPIECRSAGHGRHEWTSWACMEPVFAFIEQRMGDGGGGDAVAVKAEVVE